jgi:very-short-patch-repair endonuclease
VLARVDDWRRRLIDLSYRNRLIRYRPTKATTLTIEAPSIHELVADPGRTEPWHFFFPPEQDELQDQDTSEAADFVDEVVLRSAGERERSPKPNEIVATERNPKRISRILDNLAKRSNAEFQDKALRILYLAAGFLEWVDPARDEPLISPLVLVPVELRRETATHPYKLYFVDDEDIVVNPSLTEKLRRDSGRGIPEDWVWEDKPIGEELGEIESALKGTTWSVRESAALGLFSFQKYVMYRDLLDNEALVVEHPVVRSFALNRLVDEVGDSGPDLPDYEELDEAQPPRATLSILDADASQRLCIEAAKRGQSFVMHGPPGTGKSQTIANIITEAIGQGKRVLFVSEKAAALDVVHKRLAAQGLDEFCLMLHGERASRHEVVMALDRSLTGEVVPRITMTETDFSRLSALRQVLNDSVELLHLPMPHLGGRSLRDVYAELASLHSAPAVEGAPKASPGTDMEVLEEFQRMDEVFQRLAERWRVSPRDFVWRDYDSEDFSIEDRARVLGILRIATERQRELADQSDGVARSLGWPPPVALPAAERLVDLGRHLDSAPFLIASWLNEDAPKEIDGISRAAEDAYARLGDGIESLEASYVERDLGDFSWELDARLETALRQLADALGATEAWDIELVSSLPALRAFLAGAEELLRTYQERATQVAALLGQPDRDPTDGRAGELISLATIAFRAEGRPEHEWLVRAGFERARETSALSGSTYREYQNRLSKLSERYQPEVLELDAVAMRQRFSTEYTGALSKLKSSYRQDVKAIKQVRRDGKLPENPGQELGLIVEVKELGDQLDAVAEQHRTAFGSYFRGRDTDPGQIEAACGVAEEVRRLMAPDSDLARLSDKVCTGSQPDTQMAALADQLRTLHEQLDRGLDQLRPLTGRRSDLLDGVTLGQLRETMGQFVAKFADLEALATELNKGARDQLASLEGLRDRANVIAGVQRARQEIERSEAKWSNVLGPLFEGERTDWHAARARAAWVRQLFEFTVSGLSHEMAAKLVTPVRSWPDFEGLAQSAESYRDAVRRLVELFAEEREMELHGIATERELSEVATLFLLFREQVDELYEWTDFRVWRRQGRELGWDDFVENLIRDRHDGADVVPSFRKAFWSRRLEALFGEDPELAEDFRGATYGRWISEFKELDHKLIRTGADRLVETWNSRRLEHLAVQGSEVSVVRHEAGKKRRHRPVRKLLAGLPTLLPQLKPCLMMSPLSVSHFLTAEHRFDLVIFDEASQVPPQDAINCVYRGGQLIIAGDSEQLPPTPFFKVAEGDDRGYDEEAEGLEEDMESILDAAKVLLHEHSLRWHYRSRHEALIAFSNQHIYNGRLVTFPSPEESSQRMGISLVHVPEGIYDRGKTSTNRREAEVVAQRVVDHLLDGSGRSVGVVAFNTSQASAIGEEVDRKKIEHPEIEQFFSGDRLDNVFVKHLEAVQGDERDVIIFSVGYGYDADGRFTMNFGPLNKEGGRRRLNVAATRAREKVELVSSVRARDFTLSSESSPGPQLLRDYLQYAELEAAVPLGEPLEAEAGFPSPLEEEVAHEVELLGYKTVPQVGVGSFRIDIAVVHPEDEERFCLAIECDGESYRATPTARDRDRLREEVLAGLGWHVHRIWSLDWVRNRRAEIQRVKGALEVAVATNRFEGTVAANDPSITREKRERKERIVDELRDSNEAVSLPWVEYYRRVELPKQHSHYDFSESVNRSTQTRLLIQLVECEAPVHVEYATRRVREAYGLGRSGQRIVSAVRQSINQAKKSGLIEIRGKFLWLPDQMLASVRTPDPENDRTRREIEHIAPEEIDFAVHRLREASPGAEDDHLLRQVARVLGFESAGPRIKKALLSRLVAMRRPDAQATRETS